MASPSNQISLASGTILKVTPIDGNPNAVGVITGTQEPFEKVFRNGIRVEASTFTGAADINCDLEVSGSLIVENDIRFSIYTYTGTSGGGTTLTESDFGKATILLIEPSGGETVTIELPSPTASSNKGRYFIIKKTTSDGAVEVESAQFGTAIDGSSSLQATNQYSVLQVIATGPAHDYIIVSNEGFS